MEIRRNIEIGSLFQSSSTDFSLLDEPYITCVDAEQEFVVIYNPRNEYFALDHYSIADGKMYHTYKFPRRCKIPPRTEYCIYTCPGAPNFDHGSLMEYHVLWTNHDGSLRRMEVLNNEKCCVKLIDPKGAIISQCEAGMQNKQAAARRRLLEKQNSPFWQFWLRAQVAMLYLRVLALVGMTAACVAHSAVPFIILFWTALSFDLLSRGAVGKDAALCSVALLGDRISSIVLAGSLLFLLSQSDAASLPLEASETSGGSPSTPAIRLGAVAYYPSEESASENSTSSAPRTGVSGMAWVGMFVPGLSRKTLAAALMLELLATALNSRMLLCPREVHSYGSAVVAEIQEDEQEAQEASERIARGTQGAQDLYAYLGQLSPALLAAVGAAAEYYQLHCFTSYHYKVDGGSDDLVTAAATSAVSAPWLYDLWVLAAALGCLAFNIKMANHASLVASAVAKMLKSK